MIKQIRSERKAGHSLAAQGGRPWYSATITPYTQPNQLTTSRVAICGESDAVWRKPVAEAGISAAYSLQRRRLREHVVVERVREGRWVDQAEDVLARA